MNRNMVVVVVEIRGWRRENSRNVVVVTVEEEGKE